MTSYRVEFHAKGAAETIGLPADAYVALIETLNLVAKNPHDPATTAATDDPHIREAIFATWGLVTFWIDDDAHLVRVHGVTWAA